MGQGRVGGFGGEFADGGQGVLAILEVVNSHVLCDGAADRSNRKPPNRCCGTTFVKFLETPVPPFLAEAALREVPARPAKEEDETEDREAEDAPGNEVMNLRAPA